MQEDQHILINKKLRHWENIHIPLWLLKDTCWMMEWKILGTILIVPTISVAILLSIRTHKSSDWLINLAILCWISANAFWMCCEFYLNNEYKSLASIPFIMGLTLVSVYYLKQFYYKKTNKA